jgi:glyoxylase-like metal-dependent hydrolase (beta-lactamase superfamily II)
MKLKLGSNEFEVRFTPGHTRGHCVLYVADLHVESGRSVCFCGDVIFNGSVGRTDLPGGDWAALEHSIRTQIFTLPDETRLLSGHGPETTVGEEKANNPFVGEWSL